MAAAGSKKPIKTPISSGGQKQLKDKPRMPETQGIHHLMGIARLAARLRAAVRIRPRQDHFVLP